MISHLWGFGIGDVPGMELITGLLKLLARRLPRHGHRNNRSGRKRVGSFVGAAI